MFAPLLNSGIRKEAELLVLWTKMNFVLIDQTVSCWEFWECSGEERLRLDEPVVCHPGYLKNGECPETE